MSISGISGIAERQSTTTCRNYCGNQVPLLILIVREQYFQLDRYERRRLHKSGRAHDIPFQPGRRLGEFGDGLQHGLDGMSLMQLLEDAGQLDSATGTTTAADQLFNAIDTSGSGSISKSELETYVSNLASQSGSSTSSSTASSTSSSDTSAIDQLFNAIDTSGSGSISKSEFESYVSNLTSQSGSGTSAMSAPPPPPPPSSDSTSALDSLLQSLETSLSSTDSTTASSTIRAQPRQAHQPPMIRTRQAPSWP